MQSQHSLDEDRELVARVKAGDLAAFRSLFDKYQKRVYVICYGVVRHHEDALDIVQETFIKAHHALPYFRGDSNFYTWLYRIASNTCLDFLRKQKRRPKGEPLAEEQKLNTEEEEKKGVVLKSPDNPRKTVVERELGKEIDAAIQALPPDHRIIVILREVDQLSYEEIAKTLGVRVGTVMSRLFYARKKLQERLKGL